LHQADVASRLRPPIEVHLLTAWEHGLSLPTPSQRAQLEVMFRVRLPKSPQGVEKVTPKFDPKLPLNRDLGRQEFAVALKSAQRALGVPTLRQLALLLHVPMKSLTAAHREELPTHIKAFIAAVLGWEGRGGTLYGLLSAVQKRKFDQIARGLARKELYEVRELSGKLPATTRRRLEGLNYAWQKADRLAKRAAREGTIGRSPPQRSTAVVISLSSRKPARPLQAGGKSLRSAQAKPPTRRSVAGGR
jgi:hypothetical protein